MKKQYITPIVLASHTNVQSFLHVLSDPIVNQAAHDLTNEDTGVSSIGLDNNLGNDDVSFAKGRSDSGPWESIW